MFVLSWFNSANLPVTAIIASIVGLGLLCACTAEGIGWLFVILMGAPTVFGLCNDFDLMWHHSSFSTKYLQNSFTATVFVMVYVAVLGGSLAWLQSNFPRKAIVGLIGVFLGAFTTFLRLGALVPNKAGHGHEVPEYYSTATGYACLMLIAVSIGLFIREFWRYWRLVRTDRIFSADSL